ncbi:MAG: hypothetical protein MUO50_04595, partial [Longimicrobiales bacterium]|nr:hypothetical protein [Longimicrobiales bacterium]
MIPVVALSLLLGACTDEDAVPIASPPLLETGAYMVISGLHHIITQEGVKLAEVFADTAFSYPDSSIYQLRNLELILFTEM